MTVFLIIICAIVVFVVLSSALESCLTKDSFASEPEVHNDNSVKKVEVEVDYDNLPYTDDLMLRFCRAENKELICRRINELEKTAVFKSRIYQDMYYQTTLNSCTCSDNMVPCKHMFYLADKLGRLEKWKSNLPRKKYDELVRNYNACQYRNDPEGWARDKNVYKWRPGCTKIGGCW